MTIILDIQNDKLDVFLNFLKTLNYVKIKDNKKDFSEFSGMWKNKDIDIDKIRKKAWQR